MYRAIGKPARSKIHNPAFFGFTIMEIVVATAIFAFASVALASMFTYTLKINRRAEALRQATQGMRDFVESIVKEIRNGYVDYGVIQGQIVQSTSVGPCPIPSGAALGANPVPTPAGNSYLAVENRIGIIDSDGNRECFYLADSSGSYVGPGINAGSKLALDKPGGIHELVTPPNYTMEYLAFYIRPLCDPYITNCITYGNAAPKAQPLVTIAAKFTTRLPTGESVPIYYQTSVSSDKYDIPNSP